MQGDPRIGASFAVSGDGGAGERWPKADIDPISGDTAVVFEYAAPASAASRLGIVWLQPDPRAANHIARPRYLFPEGSFAFTQPKIELCHNQPGMFIGYSARLGTDPAYQYDAHLIDTTRWTTLLPLVWRR